MRPSTRAAFAVCLPLLFAVVFLAWRKVTAAPDGDVTGLVVATVCGTAGLTLLAIWLQDQDR